MEEIHRREFGGDNRQMIDGPLVSVIMSTYDECIDWIDYSVQSILNQTYKNIELIIVADNPDRKDIIDYLKRINDERLNLFQNESNRGLVYSLNKALYLSSGEYIARMDADDISEPDRIEKELQYLVDNNFDLVGSNVTLVDTRNTVIGKMHAPTHGKKMERFIRHLGSIPHPTWVAKKNLFHKLDGYREIDRAEDYDFLIRSFLIGGKLGCVQEELLRYRKSPKGLSKTGKGLQRYVALLLSKQMRTGKVLPIEEIYAMVSDKQSVDLFEKYYQFTGFWNAKIKKQESASKVTNPGFDIRYLIVLFKNITARIG